MMNISWVKYGDGTSRPSYGFFLTYKAKLIIHGSKGYTYFLEQVKRLEGVEEKLLVLFRKCHIAQRHSRGVEILP